MEIDHRYTDEVVCPYCGYEFEDSWEFFTNDQEDTEIDCDECDKTFVASRNITITYSTHELKPKENRQ
jgi:DNA-directed RNA polymerase subunit RPC12/RpoP